jgi:exopolyphosphatase / guanosine-5'-triphosphate,3'-diphosphate pyrophosphatase
VSRRAAIDIGTNSVRLLVADIADSRRLSPRLRPVLRRLQITRLGERLAPGGRIHPDAAARTATAVEQFVALSAGAGVLDPLLVGTHALRTAQNSGEVLTHLHHPVRILTSDEEARLGFRGVLAGLGPLRPGSRLLVVDIGGGSVELTWGSRGQVRGSVSAPAGAVVLTEKFLVHDPPRPEEIAALREHLAGTMAHDLLKPSGPTLRVVGVGGTITTLAAIEQRLSPYDPDRVHGYRLSRRAVDRMAEALIASTVAERRRLPGLQPERADIIVAGTLILQHLLTMVGAHTVTVSEADLLWALLLDQIPPRDGPDGPHCD